MKEFAIVTSVCDEDVIDKLILSIAFCVDERISILRILNICIYIYVRERERPMSKSVIKRDR